MVTHDVRKPLNWATTYLMDKGKIVQNGTPAELLFQPKNNFVREFLQEQRLSLEFKSVKLSDLWQWLTPTPQPPKGAEITAEVGVWVGMEHFKFKSGDTINIINRENNEGKSVGFEQLMSAFYQYKQQQAHE